MSSALMPTYGPLDVDFDRGEGVWLIDKAGKRYLDFGSGIAVSALGHAHPAMVAALKDQAERLWHLSNVYKVPGQAEFAERIVAETFADQVFFTNSGAEAVECALKAARRYHFDRGDEARINIVGLEKSFHGRTYGGINAAGQPNYRKGFGPDLPGYVHVPFGDHDALEAAVDDKTAAVIVEPILGEGGVRPIPTQCLKGLRELCDRHGALLIFDEVQCGMGRTGKLFAHEWAGVAPDLMAVAKGIGGGFPMGACLAVKKVGDCMVKGTHGSTFGGGPLAMAVGRTVFDIIAAPDFLAQVRETGEVLRQELAALAEARANLVQEVRGQGLMWGLVTSLDPVKVMGRAMEAGLLTLRAGSDVIRLLPPLILTPDKAREGAKRLAQAIDAAAAADDAKDAKDAA